MENGPGKGKKQCKSCLKFVGVRTLKCACGHEFKSAIGVTAAPVKMGEQTEVKENLQKFVMPPKPESPKKTEVISEFDVINDLKGNSASSKLSALTSRTSYPSSNYGTGLSADGRVVGGSSLSIKRHIYSSQFRNKGIIVPAGECPVRPKGFKGDTWPWGDKGFPDGPCKDEDIVDWALKVYESNPQYTPEAVVYFVRHFWDSSLPEYKRIVQVVRDVFKPKAYELESEDIYNLNDDFDSDSDSDSDS